MTVAVGPQALLRHRRHRIHRRRFPGCVFFSKSCHGKLTQKKIRGHLERNLPIYPHPKKKHYSMTIDWKNHRFFFLMRRKSPIWDLADRKSFLPTNQKGCWHMGTLYLFVDPGFPHFHQRVCRFQPI